MLPLPSTHWCTCSTANSSCSNRSLPRHLKGTRLHHVSGCEPVWLRAGLAASRTGCEPDWLQAGPAASRTGCKRDWQDWALLEHYDQANANCCIVPPACRTSKPGRGTSRSGAARRGGAGMPMSPTWPPAPEAPLRRYLGAMRDWVTGCEPDRRWADRVGPEKMHEHTSMRVSFPAQRRSGCNS